MSNLVESYGVQKDGTLGRCRAKPQNQGKGRCFHEKHISLTVEEVKMNIVQRYNEEVLQKAHKEQSLSKNAFPTVISPHKIQSHAGGRVLSQKELKEGSIKVAEQLNNRDWSFIQEFYQKFDRVMNDQERNAIFKDNPADNVRNYLESDDPTAKNLREFLGDEIDIQEFSEILVQHGGAMTKAKTWGIKSGNSINRVILSSLNNDMTKERYVASVVFFDGRCCYCNKALRKDPPRDRQASGEHITPINPKNPNHISGGTRYGNMALACIKCNSDRSNTELTEWIAKTKCIKPANKPKALGRIQAFREFALYSEYSKEESDRINAEADKIKKFIDSHRGVGGALISTPEFVDTVTDKIKIATFDLQHR